MLVTEKEAKEKWCPHVRFTVGIDHSPSNRWRQLDKKDNLNPETCRCIGSECMAWSWNAPQYGKKVGYCGLAGE